jgi:thiol-disulfide isomerase/thioredoxin
MVIRVDNGIQEDELPRDTSFIRQIKLKGQYFGEYAEVLVNYVSDYSQHFYESATFFVRSKHAVINFLPSEKANAYLKSYSLVNAEDFKEEKEKMTGYDSSAKKVLYQFAQQHGNKIFEDSTLRNQYYILNDDLYDHDLKYILDNKASYYAFSFFRRNYVNTRRLSSDSAMMILNTFPDHFKNGPEGTQMRNLIRGREFVKMNAPAPDFISKDINGNKVSLHGLMKKGFVLINFWASWCIPCIAEMPLLKDIYEKYKHKGLQVVSIAYSSPEKDYLKAIRDNHMNWININNDINVINSFGGQKPIPCIYLINRQGLIIYDKTELGDSNLQKLNYLIASLIAQ